MRPGAQAFPQALPSAESRLKHSFLRVPASSFGCFTFLLLQAAAVDPHGSKGVEIHVAQHGQPAVYVFDHEGGYLRLWGAE